MDLRQQYVVCVGKVKAPFRHSPYTIHVRIMAVEQARDKVTDLEVLVSHLIFYLSLASSVHISVARSISIPDVLIPSTLGLSIQLMWVCGIVVVLHRYPVNGNVHVHCIFAYLGANTYPSLIFNKSILMVLSNKLFLLQFNRVCWNGGLQNRGNEENT